MSERRQLILASALLLVISSTLLLSSLSTQPFEVYDEGLYGMYARTALRFDTWLHVVNTTGEYPTGAVKFSKPPLSVWAVAMSMDTFGPSLFSLRFPFALATLFTALLALAFGRLLAPSSKGTWLGFMWGLLLVVSQGATAYGRTATIEALLVVFVTLALYAYARALRSSSAASAGWAALAGLAIGGAFMTKQLVCALAILPIGAIELLRVRRELRASLTRMLVCFGVPTLAVGYWGYLFYQKVGHAALDVLWEHAIVRRVAGFDGTHHQNYLNRIANLLDQDALPMSWPLGLMGLVLMLAPSDPGSRERREAGLLVFGSGACAWLAFDVGSRAILPWYAYSFLPAIALGQAWLVVNAIEALLGPWPTERLPQLSAAGGLASMVVCAAAAMRGLVPALLVVVFASVCVVLAISLRVAIQRRRILSGGAAAWAMLLVAGTLARAEYRATEPNVYAELGEALYRRGARNISLDGRSQLHNYARTTFLGVNLSAGGEPWVGGGANKKAHADARIQIEVLPSELQPQPGVELIRGIGAYAVFGDLRSAPFAPDAVEKLLARGPLTFEAEAFTTGRPDTLRRDAGASGGAVRRVDPWFRERAETFSLVRGTSVRMPAGHYTVKFWSKLACDRFRGEQLGQATVNARGRKVARALRCGFTPAAAENEGQSMAIDLSSAATMDFSMQITQGALTLDRITVTRSEAASGARKPPASTGTPAAPTAPKNAAP